MGMKITINETYTEQSLNRFNNTPILKFKSETTHFDSLGYPPVISKYVILQDNSEWSIKTNLTVRALNKFVKQGDNTITKIKRR